MYLWLCKINQKNINDMNFPAELRYSKDHEWVKVDGNVAYIGITDFAQSQLGDIVFIDVATVGDTLAADEVFGSIEAVKTVSDAFMPVGGEVLEFNEALNDAPDAVNKDPYGDGWMIKVKMSDPSEVGNLMDAAAYKAMVG